MEKISREYSSVRTAEFHDESNDCVVKAFTLVLNKPYAEIHEACKRNGRKDRKGTFGGTQHKVAQEYGMKLIEPHSLSTSSHFYYPTLAQFINAFPKGRFYVVRAGHAFAVIDGVVHDNTRQTGSRSRIKRAFEAV